MFTAGAQNQTGVALKERVKAFPKWYSCLLTVNPFGAEEVKRNC
jgi:hypothetical protein